MPATKRKKKASKKKVSKGKTKADGRKEGSGRPTKYSDPVDKSIRMERGDWDALEGMCPPYVRKLGSWNDKMQILLDLARKGYAG